MHYIAKHACRSIKASSSRSFSASSSLSYAASSSKNIYPFPSNPNATPHQIFHLPPGADQDAIKSRYYELVKIHHPDLAGSIDSATAHDRFQKIQSAYARLRNAPTGSTLTPRRYAYQYTAEEVAGRRWTGGRNEWGGFEYEYDDDFAQRGASAKGGAGVKDGPRYEKVFHSEDTAYWVFGTAVVLTGIAQFVWFSPAAEASRHHRSALTAMEEVQRARQEHGMARRAEVKRFVQERRGATAGELESQSDTDDLDAQATH